MTPAGWFRCEPVGAGRRRWVPPPMVATPSGAAAGGALAGAAATALEAATGRAPAWCTTQFASPLPASTPVDFAVEGHAGGPVRVTATAGGRVVAVVLGATGPAAARPAPPLPPPDLPAPADAPACPFLALVGGDAGTGMAGAVELRLALGATTLLDGRDTAPGAGRVVLWVRVGGSGPRPFDPGTLAFVGDLAPVALTDALGTLAGGVSLDNTIRYGPPGTGEWLLLDARLTLAADGFAHLAGELWSDGGSLLATVAQSCTVR